MTDWLLLLRSPRFRAFWLALVCESMGGWCVVAALPILVAARFGAGTELVVSLGLRLLPKLALAPFAGRLLGRFGAARVASTAMLAMAGLTAALPWCRSILLLQGVVAAIGTLDLFVVPGLLSLRGPMTPAAKAMAGNTLCSVADRAARVAGPAIGGLAIAAGFESAFAGFGILIGLASVPVSRLPVPVGGGTRREPGLLLSGFLKMIRTDRQITGLLVMALTYMVLLRGLQPFLFWANRDWFGGADSAWTGLLVAQGAGALIGALASALVVPRLLWVMSAYRLSLAAGRMESLIHLLLLFAVSIGQAAVILALAGIPEIISTAAWFTVIQQRLSPRQQGGFFTFAVPLFDVFLAVGIASAGLHAAGELSLSGYWALISLIATLPLLPLLAWRVSPSGG